MTGRLPRGLWLLFAAQVLLVAGLALSFPFFALYLNRSRGMPMDRVGAMLALSILGAAVSQGLGGELSDAWGRRAVMAGSLWLRTVLVAVMSLCIWRGLPAWAVISAHIAATFVGNFFDPAARGWIADHCPPSERLRAYGLLRVAINLGWAVGPAVGGVVAERSYAGMFLASSLVCAAVALAVGASLPEAAGPARPGAFDPIGFFEAARDGRFTLFCAFGGLIGVVMAQMFVPLSVYAVRSVSLRESQVGLLYSLNGIIVVASQDLATRLLSRWRITTALCGGSVLYALGYGAVGFARRFGSMAAAMCVISFGEVSVSPGLQALAANMAPEDLKGRYLGFCAFMQQAGCALGPLLGGFFLQHLGSAWLPGPWLIMAAVGLLAAGGFLSLRPRMSIAEEGLKI